MGGSNWGGPAARLGDALAKIGIFHHMYEDLEHRVARLEVHICLSCLHF